MQSDPGQAIFQEQYDSAIFNNVQALPAFQKRFGKAVPPKDKSYQLTPSIQLALSEFIHLIRNDHLKVAGNVGHAGHLIGIFFNGYLVDWIGRESRAAGCPHSLQFQQNDVDACSSSAW